MDIRFLLILAVVAAIMEILGRLARRSAGTGAPRVQGPDGADPLMQQLEELEWVPGTHDEEDDTPAPRRERPAAAAAPERVREPERLPLPPELPPAAVPREPRPAPVPRQPPPAPERVVVFRDRAPRPVPIRSREARRVEVRPVAPRPVALPPVKPRPVEREASASVGGPGGAGGRLGLGTVNGLRRLVVAREVLGPPIALRDGERGT